MSANRIFLVCSHHKGPEHALVIAERHDADSQYECAIDGRCRCMNCTCARDNQKRVREWFKKHEYCGPERGRDHFQIAYGRPQDWDHAPPAENTPAGAVKLALLNGSKHE